MSGINESSSLHKTSKAGSENALQVRDKRESERLPPVESRMASRSLFVASASRRIEGAIVCWETEGGTCDDRMLILLLVLSRVRRRRRDNAERRSDTSEVVDIFSPGQIISYLTGHCANNMHYRLEAAGMQAA